MSKPVRGLEAAKSRAVDLLAESFAQDQLTMEDFERRVALVHRAASMGELERAVADLPAAGGSDAAPAPSAHGPPKRLPPARVRESDRAVAVFGETKRTGRWMPARRTQVVSVFASALIDLREATLAPGEYTLTAWSVLGSVEVIVPPGVAVECAGSAVLGSFEQIDPGLPEVPHGARGATTIRMEGMSVLGSVEVVVRYPGETKREARRRRRVEKKARRKLAAPRR